MEKIKKEHFRITGVQYYQDDFVEQLGSYNYDYDEKASDLKESYDSGDRIYQYDFSGLKAELVPEPENEYDPNAVKVMVNGIQVGHVKKGSCSRVKNLMKSPDFVRIDIEISGGKYKEIVENDEGKMRVIKEERPYYVDVDILLRDNSESEPFEPAADPPDIKPAVRHSLIQEDITPNPDLKTALKDKVRLLVTAAAIVFIIIIICCII